MDNLGLASFLGEGEEIQYNNTFQSGDPYPEDSVRRGVNLNAYVDISNAVPTFFDGYTDDFGHGFYDIGPLADPDADYKGGAFSSTPGFFGIPDSDKPSPTQQRVTRVAIERFSPQSAPPSLSKHYPLAITTLYLETKVKFAALPADLMNAVLDFLEHDEGVKANVKTTDIAKYAIDATVWMSHKMCNVRVNMLHEGSDKYALEFTRLNGDCFSFMDLYNLATKALKAKHLLDPTREPLAKPSFAPPPMDFLDDLEDEFVFDCDDEPMIGPLLCAARMKEYPTEQAEAASGLADAVSDKRLGAKTVQVLCREIEVVLDIMECKYEDAGYQAARLVEALVQHEIAATLLVRPDFVEKLTEKIVSDESKLVQSEFKKIADLINEKHGKVLSTQAKDLFAKATTILEPCVDAKIASSGFSYGKVVGNDFQASTFASPLPAV